MIGRLVEQKKIGLTVDQLTEAYLGLFAAT